MTTCWTPPLLAADRPRRDAITTGCINRSRWSLANRASAINRNKSNISRLFRRSRLWWRVIGHRWRRCARRRRRCLGRRAEQCLVVMLLFHWRRQRRRHFVVDRIVTRWFVAILECWAARWHVVIVHSEVFSLFFLYKFLVFFIIFCQSNRLLLSNTYI